MAGFFDDETLQKDLEKFPSSFKLELTNLSKDRVKSLIKKMSSYELDTGDIHINNFLSYLYFLLEDFDHANQYVDESLQNDPDNIIANANKARFLSEAGEISDVEDIVTKLKELEKRDDYSKRKCYAEAGLANAYSRCGPWFHQKAVDIYNRILLEYPTEYEWKYSLALTLLRQTHCLFSQSEDRFNSEQKERKTVQVAEMLLTVVTKSDDPMLCAQAYARLGKAMYGIEKGMFTNVTQTVKALDSKTCFEKAAEKCQDEPSVLGICGQHARYRGELETSEKLLRKSLQINPTCRAYHHLALTLERKVECGLDREQSVNSTEEHLGKGNGQKQRDEQLRRGDNWRHYQAKGQNTKYFQSKQNKGQCKRYQYGNANDAFDSCWDTNENVGWTGDRRNVKQKKRGTHKEQNLRRAIKSPLKVQTYSGNKSLIEAVALLEKTEELDQYALGIQYDKGIMYRKLGQIEKAVEVFKQIVSKRKYLPTKTLLTNVYEQLGLCLLELSQSEEVSSGIQQKHKKDGKCHLSRAVQLQSEIVANDPQFKAAWNSYPTLRELLSDERDGKPKQLAVLQMLMGDHKDSISIYQELVLKEEAEMNPEDYINMLECYKKDGEHEKCVTLLRSWECTTIFSGLPQSLIFDVYMNGGFHAYTTDNAQLAYQHFRSAFKVYGMFDKTNEDRTNTDEDDDTKDILILHSCAQKWKCKLPRNLGTILEDCTGLRYTINTDDVLGGTVVLESMASVIQKIPCIIIMTHDSAEEYETIYVNLAIKMSSEKGGPHILVSSDDNCNVPHIAKTKPFIRMPPLLEDTMDPKQQIPDVHQDWIKEFITLLKPK